MTKPRSHRRPKKPKKRKKKLTSTLGFEALGKRAVTAFRRVISFPRLFSDNLMKCLLKAFEAVFVTSNRSGASSQSGFAPFTALATFALTQSVALTAVAKGRGRDIVVLTIYAITTIATVLWIWWMLRSERATDDKTSDMAVGAEKGRTEAFFDDASMRFGRITLAWTIVLGCTLFGLAVGGLLPNQSPKIVYESKTVKKCIGRVHLGSPQSLDPRLDALPLLSWLPKAATDEKERFVVIQQNDPFEASYFDFSLDLQCNNTYEFTRRAAFLVNSEGPLNLRSLPFSELGAMPKRVVTINVQNAEPNDRVVVLAYMKNKVAPGTFDPTLDKYEVKLVPPGFSPPAN